MTPHPRSPQSRSATSSGPSPGAPSPPRTRVFGVLGGIASGKSTVSEALAGPDGLILSADREAHLALELPEIQERLLDRFGPGVIGPDGRTDRPALGRLVFGDKVARKALEGWIHPVVRARLWQAFRNAVAAGTPVVVVDVPLLLETALASSEDRGTAQLPARSPQSLDELPPVPPPEGLFRYCDSLVFVDAPIAARDARAVANRGWQEGEVARREAAQMPLDVKRGHADLIIQNDQGPEELRARVRAAVLGLDHPQNTDS